ncbi:MAG: hypothetical protein JXR15_10835 [Shimia sp.]|uniref:hypothetical protein n=1 Tax=Shimia sp. TaxID=1954381 RepID=UPI003B8BC946
MVGLAALGTAIFWIDFQLKRRRGHRPLSQSKPSRANSKLTPKKELGMEALDLELVDSANKENERIGKDNAIETQRAR